MSPTIERMQEVYGKYFSLGYLNNDINTKLALIALTGYLVYRLREKKPDITAYQVLTKIAGNECPEDFIKGVAVVVEDFSYGCKEFPTFGIEDKKIPSKIKEILKDYLPF